MRRYIFEITYLHFILTFCFLIKKSLKKYAKIGKVYKISFGQLPIKILISLTYLVYVMSPLVTKLFLVVLIHKNITQLDLKKSRPWYTCDLSLHQVSAMSVHYLWRYEHFSERHFSFLWSDFVAFSRNLWATQIPCYNDNYSNYRVHGTQNDQLGLTVLT